MWILETVDPRNGAGRWLEFASSVIPNVGECWLGLGPYPGDSQGGEPTLFTSFVSDSQESLLLVV